MSGGYAKPSAAAGMLRLHLNENTAGCSPRVVEALRSFSAIDAACYPDYTEAIAAVGRHFGVPADLLLLTNGLDEGILAAAAVAFRRRDHTTPEAIGVVPAFDMYEVAVDALGGRMTSVPLGHGYAFPSSEIVRAVSSATRMVFVTTPHNPTGMPVPLDDIRSLARRIAPAIIFVDEAYAGFTGDTLIAAETFEAHPNMIVGRTFAKADGLAGLRIGALFGARPLLDLARRVVPPYSVNAAAAAVLPIALDDEAHREWYYGQCRESRALLAAACDRLGLAVIPSVTNFMLVHAGARASDLAEALRARGVAVRDRSAEVGTAGCLRMTTGVVEDTRRLVAALEDACRGVE